MSTLYIYDILLLYKSNLIVRQDVILQAIRSSETLLTLLTNIRLLPTVYPDMCLQATRLSETLLTMLTSIRLLPPVYLSMFHQVIRFSETLLTLLTSIRLLPTICILACFFRLPDLVKLCSHC